MAELNLFADIAKAHEYIIRILFSIAGEMLSPE